MVVVGNSNTDFSHVCVLHLIIIIHRRRLLRSNGGFCTHRKGLIGYGVPQKTGLTVFSQIHYCAFQ